MSRQITTDMNILTETIKILMTVTNFQLEIGEKKKKKVNTREKNPRNLNHNNNFFLPRNYTAKITLNIGKHETGEI